MTTEPIPSTQTEKAAPPKRGPRKPSKDLEETRALFRQVLDAAGGIEGVTALPETKLRAAVKAIGAARKERKRPARPGEGKQKTGADKATVKINAYPSERDWLLVQSQKQSVPTAEIIARLRQLHEKE